MSFNARILPLVIAAALFMEQMDSTIIATSLPDIAADLGVSPIALKLAFTTYLLGLTVFLPVSGWAADRFGAKTVFRTAIVVFTAGSVACGFAESLHWLVAARGLQGVGGALMVPVGRIILLRSVEKSELLDAIAWLTIPALIGPVIGPPVGGYITTAYDWRWIFWMNLPFGVIAFALASWLMPNVKAAEPPPLDVRGFLLVGRRADAGGVRPDGGGAGDVFRRAGGHDDHGGAHPCWWPMWCTRGRAAAPILDLRLMRIATFRHSVTGGNLFRIAVGAAPFILPLMLQLGFGFSAFASGMITFASALGAVLMKFTVARIVRHFGYRNLLIVNGLACCAMFAAKGLFTAQTPYWIMFGLLLVAGFMRSLQFSALNTLAYADVERAEVAKANTLYTVLQQLFLALGWRLRRSCSISACGGQGGACWWRLIFRSCSWWLRRFRLLPLSSTCGCTRMRDPAFRAGARSDEA
jgi:MFS family permease